MPNGNENLWPADVGTSTIVPPLAILRRQAVALGERTQGLLEGQVETLTERGEFTQVFYVVAPSLSYRYKLFEVRHGVEGYPAYPDKWDRTKRPVVQLKLDTPEKLAEWLKDTLASDETKRVVGSLLSQVKA